jgi:hypothetical protein
MRRREVFRERMRCQKRDKTRNVVAVLFGLDPRATCYGEEDGGNAEVWSKPS